MTAKSRRIGPLRSGVTALAFLFLLALIAASLNAGPQEVLQGPFRIVDGDTLAHGQTRIRLKNIDAPELAQKCMLNEQEWKCGVASKAALSAHIRQGEVECKGTGFDRYGRLLALCRLGDDDLNAWLVNQGYALAYGSYTRQESEARVARRGIWAGEFERPSDWRRSRKLEEADRQVLSISFLCERFGVFCAQTGGDANEAF